MKFSIKKLKQAKWKKKTRLVQHNDYEEVDNQIINIPEISDASVISEEVVDIKNGYIKWEYKDGHCLSNKIKVFKKNKRPLWSCRTHFGTVGASSFGSWNSFNTKEEAVNLLNELVEVFSTMIECPSQEMLNLKFRELGVSFWIE